MTLHGMEALQKLLQTSPEFVRAKAEAAVAASTFSVAQRMRSLVPVNTGLLRSSIFSSSRGLRGRVEIGVDAFYWHFVEYGTIHMPARPFARTAAEEEIPIFIKRFEDIPDQLSQRFDALRAA